MGDDFLIKKPFTIRRDTSYVTHGGCVMPCDLKTGTASGRPEDVRGAST